MRLGPLCPHLSMSHALEGVSRKALLRVAIVGAYVYISRIDVGGGQ